jgi:TetR/AcrR family transcriptional regulator, mexCD-oprJ operon repressor
MPSPHNTAPRSTAYQRQTARQNIEAILDAAEEQVRLHGQVSVSAVAARAGVSRVTVYAHFPTGDLLLEAAVGRAVQLTVTALESARPGDGPAAAALDRLLTGAWQHLARYGAMAEAVAGRLSPDAVTRTHQAAHRAIGDLIERGQADGSFRTDLPAGWLTAACIALIHTCYDGVRAGRIPQPDAVRILTTSVRDLFTGTGHPGQGRPA